MLLFLLLHKIKATKIFHHNEHSSFHLRMNALMGATQKRRRRNFESKACINMIMMMIERLLVRKKGIIEYNRDFGSHGKEYKEISASAE